MTAVTPSPSGLAVVDHQWGGLAAGRAYLLVGRAGAGRSALALQTVRAAVEAHDRCLVISPRSPDELVEIGHEVGLDLAAAHTQGRLRLLRIPKAADLAARGAEGLAKSYRDLIALVAADQPARVVIEDFTPLVQFDTFERFHDAFGGLVGALREQGATLVIGLGDPANDASRRLLDVVEGLVDGTIRLGAAGDLTLDTPARSTYSSNDGASVDAVAPPEPPAATPSPAAETEPSEPPPLEPPPAPTPAPASEGFSTTFSSGTAPELEPAAPARRPAPTAPPEPTAPSEPPAAEAPGSEGAGGPPDTEIVPPPPPDPALLAPPEDAFGDDPADMLFAQGYLADSRGSVGIGQVPPRVAPPPASAPAFPAFAPLGAPAPADPGVAFRTALDAAFAAHGVGTPFVVVALRMDPAAPDAAHFGAIEGSLRAALRPDRPAPGRRPARPGRRRPAVVGAGRGPDLVRRAPVPPPRPPRARRRPGAPVRRRGDHPQRPAVPDLDRPRPLRVRGVAASPRLGTEAGRVGVSG